MKELFENVFFQSGSFYTLSLAPSLQVYGEKLVKVNEREFRQWNPFRSKIAAALKKGLKQLPIHKGSNVLYLGAGEGTTVSHISDIVGMQGVVFAVDVSAVCMRKMVRIAEQRPNILPILADASKPEQYAEHLKDFKISVLFQDVSQKNQAEIFLKNAKAFLEKGCFGLLSLKAKSINVSEKPEKVFKSEINKLKQDFQIIQSIPLGPFEKHHALVYCRKK